MPNKDELDVLLDSALATYGDLGTDTGLEERVLAAVATERAFREKGRAVRWRRWLAWAISVPVAASLLVWLGVEKIRQETLKEAIHQAYRAQTAPTTTATEPRPPEKNTNRVLGAKAHGDVAVVSARLKPCPVREPGWLERSGALSASCPAAHAKTQPGEAAPLPKLDVFPSPQPLTAEEQALVLAAHSGSKAERDALVELRPPSDAPLSIAALDVAPLAARDDDGKN